MDIWGVGQQIEDSLSPLLCLLDTKIWINIRGKKKRKKLNLNMYNIDKKLISS